MVKSEYAEFRGLLLDTRKEISGHIEHIKETGLSLSARDSVRELSLLDNHPADVASETFERGKDLGLKINAQHMLGRIDDALRLMDKGEYGNCQRCGQEIERERLLTVPWTMYCAGCAHFLDEGLHKSRPVEEEVIRMPFGSHDLVRDYAGYDGRDTWEDVSLGGTANSPQDQSGAVDFDDMRHEGAPGYRGQWNSPHHQKKEHERR